MSPSPPPHRLTITTPDHQTRIHDLETSVSALQADNRALLTERQALKADVLRLTTHRTVLQNGIDILLAQRDDRVAEKTALEDSHSFYCSKLRTEKWVLQTAMHALGVEKDGLEAENARLEVENARLGDVERKWLAREFSLADCELRFVWDAVRKRLIDGLE
ncbi:hypothetical protein MMC17_007782 [Xylographa soralifera]|nr:hypothetical protein [Xylographa soralifera]